MVFTDTSQHRTYQHGTNLETSVSSPKRNNEAIFKKVVEYHDRKIRGIVGSRVYNKSDWDDLVQKTYFKIWNGLMNKSYDQNRGLRPWISTIANNVVTDYLRKEGRSKRWIITLPYNKEVEPSYNEGSDCETELLETKAKLLEARDNRTDRERVRDLLPILSETHQEILRMVAFEGKSHREIAKKLGITEGAVKLRLFRARKNAKKILKV